MTSFDVVEQEGLNCQLAVHIILEELGYSLPKWLRSKEIFEDEIFLETVFMYHCATTDLSIEIFQNSRVGDICFFSNTGTRSDDYDPKYFHMAVISDFSGGEPVFSHARKSNSDPDAVIDVPLQRMKKSKKYKLFHGVRRVRSRVGLTAEEKITWLYSQFL